MLGIRKETAAVPSMGGGSPLLVYLAFLLLCVGVFLICYGFLEDEKKAWALFAVVAALGIAAYFVISTVG